MIARCGVLLTVGCAVLIAAAVMMGAALPYAGSVSFWQFTYQPQPNPTTEERRMVFDLTRWTLMPLREQENAMVSPDGRWELFFYEDGLRVELHRRDVQTGQTAVIFNIGARRVFEWSPTSEQIAYLTFDSADFSSVYVSNIVRNQHEQITFGVNVRNFAWSPDGTQIAYIHGRNTDGYTLSRMDLNTRETVDLISRERLSEPVWIAPDALYVVSLSSEMQWYHLIGIDGQGREFRRVPLPAGFNGGVDGWS